MSRIVITGSAQGLGRSAAETLLDQGHEVVVHARSPERASSLADLAARGAAVVVGDLGDDGQTRDVADQVNSLGRMDAVIHNAGVYLQSRRITTIDGLPQVFAINTLAPYILTALIRKPKRLVYMSSGLHRSGDTSLKDLTWSERKWNSSGAYADSKLYDVMLAFAVARKWPDVLSNAVDPGWVPTRMGGPNATDDLDAGAETQVWLATSEDPAAMVSGEYFHHQKRRAPLASARDDSNQQRLIVECARISGVPLPA